MSRSAWEAWEGVRLRYDKIVVTKPDPMIVANLKNAILWNLDMAAKVDGALPIWEEPHSCVMH